MHKLVEEELTSNLTSLREGLSNKFASDADNKYKDVLSKLVTLKHLAPGSDEFAQYQDVFFDINDILNDGDFGDTISDLCFLLIGIHAVYSKANPEARASDPEEVYIQLAGEIEQGI